MISLARTRNAFLLGIAVNVSACRPGDVQATARPVSIVVSCDTAGWIAPCGCSAKQSGGLARRATLISNLRQNADVVVVDAGGAPGGQADYDVAKFESILRGEVAMNVAAHNIGASEASLGAETLRRLAASTKTPLFSTNVRDAMGQEIVPDHRVVKVGQLRLAVLGVLSPSLSAGLKVGDPRTSCLTVLDRLKGQFDAVLILAYLPEDELVAFATQIPAADLVFGGPTGQTIPPRRAGPTLWGAVTNKGKFLARIDRASPKVNWQAEILELGPDVSDDAGQVANLVSFRERLAELDLSAAQTEFGPAVAEIRSSGEIAGTDSCRECHAEEWKSWQASTHSHAWSSLTAQSAEADSYCQSCHTTGYGSAGGFVSLKKSAHRVSVGCENCHGPAAAHVRDPEVKTLYSAREKCVHCHDHDNSPDFEAESYWKKIAHGTGAANVSSSRQGGN